MALSVGPDMAAVLLFKNTNMAAVTSRENTLFNTCTNPIIHLFYPQKICIGIVFDFPGEIFMSREKLQRMVMQKFWGVIGVYYGIVQVVNISV